MATNSQRSVFNQLHEYTGKSSVSILPTFVLLSASGECTTQTCPKSIHLCVTLRVYERYIHSYTLGEWNKHSGFCSVWSLFLFNHNMMPCVLKKKLKRDEDKKNCLHSNARACNRARTTTHARTHTHTHTHRHARPHSRSDCHIDQKGALTLYVKIATPFPKTSSPCLVLA